MAGKIVLFGATGYTGRLVARSLAEAGARPLLVGRNERRLEALAQQLGGLDCAVATSDRTTELADLLELGDVLVTTVGPFLRHGRCAIEAAIDTGAHYIDSTGEPPFIRRVFEEWGGQARGRCALLTGFGLDFVGGNLAAAIALREAGDRARRVEVGYFATGRSSDGVSSGSLASGARLALEQSFAFRGGQLVAERNAKRVRSFRVDGRTRTAISVGGTEHFSLPRLAPQLEQVETYLGVGPAAWALQSTAAVSELFAGFAPVRLLAEAWTAPLAARTGRGPSEGQRQRSGCLVVATVRDDRGEALSEVRLVGPNAYTFTGHVMAWAARQIAAEGLEVSGALGPVEAFGLGNLDAGCAWAGLERA